MIKPEVIGLPKFLVEIDRWEKAVHSMLEGIAKGIATEAAVRILDYSPQYSGDFAAGWKVSVGETFKPSFQSGVLGKFYPDDNPFIMGDSPAIEYAIANMSGQLDSFRLGQTIWIHNSAEHLTTYAWKIEGNMIKFRPGNEGGTIGRTMDEMRIAYSTITKADADHLIRYSI